MLPSERRRLEDTAAREAAGESLWTTEFDRPALVRIAEIGSTLLRIDQRADSHDVADKLGFILRRSVGWQVESVYIGNLASFKEADFILDVIAAMPEALAMANVNGQLVGKYAEAVNKVLREHRIAYKFIDGELISFESDELLQAAVEPALRLMADSRFKSAHDSYMKALKEISNNDPGDAITDASTALQQALVQLGAKGNALGPLMKDAKRRGLLGTHDQPLIDALGRMIDWVSSDRSALGDAHDHSQAVLADAWLAVHIVGALIVRLADPELRGEAPG